MREIKRKSAFPVYIAADVFAVYTPIFPMYKLLHLLRPPEREGRP